MNRYCVSYMFQADDGVGYGCADFDFGAPLKSHTQVVDILQNEHGLKKVTPTSIYKYEACNE